MKSTIAGKIGIPLVLLACGGIASFIAFWVFLVHTSGYEPFGNAVPQLLIQTRDLQIFAALAADGDAESRDALHRQTASFATFLNALQNGGTWAGQTYRPSPPDAAAALAGMRRIWKSAEPDLLRLARSSAGSPDAEARARVAKSLDALAGEASAVLQGCAIAHHDHEHQLLGILAAIAALDLMLFAAGLWLTNRHVVRPVRLLEQAARRLRGGDFSARVPVLTHDELATLAGTFNDMSAEISRLLATVESERRAALDSGERLRELIGDLDAIVWEGEPDPCRFTFVSQRAEIILGYPVAAWTFAPGFWPEHLHPEDRERVMEALHRAARQPGDHDIEFRTIASDGREIWLHNHLHVAGPGEGGAPVRGLMVDITARKQSEQALARSEATSRALLNAIPDMIFRLTGDGRLLDFRGASGTRQYWPPEGFVGRTVADVLPPEATAAILARVRDAISTGKIQILHYEPGSRPQLHFEIRIVGLAHDEALAIVRDITEQKQAELALNRAGQELQLVMSSVSDFMWSAEVVDGRVERRYYSPVVERITGRSAGSFTDGSVHWDDMIHPDDRAGASESLARIMGDEIPGEAEYRVIHASGAVRWVRNSVNVARLDDGRLHLYGVVCDITAHKRRDESLRAANDTLRAVIEASPLAIYALDFEGRVRSWNPAAERIFGWKAEEVLGNSIPFVAEEDYGALDANLERSRKGERLSGLELRRRRRDGSAIEVSLWSAELRDAAGAISGFIVVGADITRRKALEERLRHSQKMEAIGRLAGGVAHDFNNLLTVITCCAQMARDEAGPSSDVTDNIDEVLRASGRASVLTTQLLAFSRRQIAQMKVLDLNAIVSGMDGMLRRIAGENIEVAIDLDAALAPVMADPAQIEQVILNLVVNSRDAMPGGGRIEIQTANAPDGSVSLSLADTGCGMEPAVLDRVFEPFFTTKEVGKGTGLGLPTVYGIVKQAGGEISISSAPGKGTVVRIAMPAASAGPEAAASKGLVAPDERDAMLCGGETILLVEDANAVRTLACSILRKCGYNILEAATPEEAIAISAARNEPIHLLLTDIMMPGINGRQLAETLAPARPEMRMLFMSGYAEDPILRTVLGGSDVAFLPKPFTPPGLARRVREILSGPSVERA